jgi:hypothetical protein
MEGVMRVRWRGIARRVWRRVRGAFGGAFGARLGCLRDGYRGC